MEGQDNWNNRYDNNNNNNNKKKKKKKKNLSEPIPPAENKYGSLAPSLSLFSIVATHWHETTGKM